MTELPAPDPSAVIKSESVNSIEVILKVAERCNLACSYCYYFYGGDESYKSRPGVIAHETIDKIADYLSQGVRDLDVKRLLIVFHGGEPLLMKRSLFSHACHELRTRLDPIVQLSLSVQTNGVLLNDDWISLFKQYRVSVGVSLDGTEALNDRYRVDHKGRGSHAKSKEGILKAVAQSKGHAYIRPGLLTVLRAGEDYKEIYRHFVDELLSRSVSTLLPDCSHDDGIPDGRTAEEYGQALCDVFDEWGEDPVVRFREADGFFDHLQNLHDRTGAPVAYSRPRGRIVVIQSDGDVSIDDSYMMTGAWRRENAGSSIFQESLCSWLSNDVFQQIDAATETLPLSCQSCVWRRPCRGGSLENRYSSANGFDNPSVFCAGLKIFYKHMATHLVRSGYPVADMLARLEAP